MFVFEMHVYSNYGSYTTYQAHLHYEALEECSINNSLIFSTTTLEYIV